MTLSKRLDELESRVAASSGSGDSTPIGIYRPSDNGPEFVKAIKYQDGEWVDTDEPHKATIPEAMLPALTANTRFIGIIGGRGSGKSQGWAQVSGIKMADQGVKVGCFREFQNSIEDSVYSIIESQVKRLGLSNFTFINNAIRSASGGEAKFRGLARNPDSIKSMDGFGMFWVEEAQASTENSLKLLTPTMRKEGGQIVFTANPGSSEDPFSKRFITPFKDAIDRDGFYQDDLHTIVRVNWKDNPWFPDELNQERLWDLEHLPRALYDHIWEGEFNDSVENGLIMAEWFDACIDAHKKLKGFEPRGVRRVSHDPSDLGSDPKALCERVGNIIVNVMERDDLDVNDGSDWATGYAVQVNADRYEFDVGGMGTGLKRQVNEALQGTKIHVSLFNGAESPDRPDAIYQPSVAANINDQKTNKQVFKNMRAQCYASLRDRVYNTYRAVVHGEMKDVEDLISFSSECDHLGKLRSELCRMPIKPNGSGLVELYTKADMRKIFKVSSPNLGDCVMMTERKHVVAANDIDVSDLYIPTVNHW